MGAGLTHAYPTDTATTTTTSTTTAAIPNDSIAVITGSVIGSISFVLLVVIILVVCSVKRYKTNVKQSRYCCALKLRIVH